MDLKKGVDL
uniref:Uncharacterized protein n=1 Tax=Arundo donax TaxID=35708 RepID=A0A0A8XWQ9_ARUDO